MGKGENLLSNTKSARITFEIPSKISVISLTDNEVVLETKATPDFNLLKVFRVLLEYLTKKQ